MFVPETSRPQRPTECGIGLLFIRTSVYDFGFDHKGRRGILALCTVRLKSVGSLFVAAALLHMGWLVFASDSAGRSDGGQPAVFPDDSDRPDAQRVRAGRVILDRTIVFAQQPILSTEVDGSIATRRGDIPRGGRIVSWNPTSTSRRPTNLTAGFDSVGGFDISFDGQRILFVGTRGDDPAPAVWEMDADGSSARLITRGVGACVDAIYLSTLYLLLDEEPRNRVAFLCRQDGSQAPALYTCHRDGSDLQQITFAPRGVRDPLLLSDGRLVFSMSSPSGANDAKNTLANESLFTIFPDGADLFPFAGVHEDHARRGMAAEIMNGQVIYVTSNGLDSLGGGSLVTVSTTRSLRSSRVLTEVRTGFYHSPAALSAAEILVSYRHKQANSYGVYAFDPQTALQRLIYDSPEWHELHAKVLRPRHAPAGRSSGVRTDTRTGQLFCLDAYRVGLDRRDPDMGKRIKWARVVAMRPKTMTDAARRATGMRAVPASHETARSPVVLGEVPVEPDGSFFLQVPAKTPLQLETLDGKGGSILAMNSWFWVMPGERRGCIGCHEDRELTPPNRSVSAFRRRPMIPKLGAAPVGGDRP